MYIYASIGVTSVMLNSLLITQHPYTCIRINLSSYAKQTANMDDKYTPHLSITKTSITNYAYNGKIMLISVIVLFVFCLSFAAFHFYSNSVLLRRSRNLLRHRLHHRRSSFTSDVSPDSPLSGATTKGLSSSVVNALSSFVYSASRKVASPLVCAVCLSEFKKNETGRVLPKCNHRFHIECIDMWFLSHSTCPLCRAAVQLSPGPSHNPTETIINVVGHDIVDSELGPNYSCNRMVQSSSYSYLPQLLDSGSVDIGPITARKLTGSEQMCKPVRTLTRFLSI